jgi:hypothetical protein
VRVGLGAVPMRGLFALAACGRALTVARGERGRIGGHTMRTGLARAETGIGSVVL